MADEIERRVAAHARRHGLLPSGWRVLAMVSGGPDSMCLLGLLARIHRPELVGVLSVDHGLRPESAAEADLVRRTAALMGIDCEIVRPEIASGAGLPARARDARLRAGRDAARRGRYARIATGHTADDQAETVLFRLARGTGRSGAMGIAPRRDAMVRPLLTASRAETRAWCRAHGMPFVDDPSNDDRRHTRSRIRHGLLPALGEVHPEATRHVAAFADILRDEQEILDGSVDAAWRRCAAGPGLDVASLGAERGALARLLVRRLLARSGLGGEALASAAVTRVLGLRGRESCDLPGGRAAIDDGRLIAWPAAPAPLAAPLAVPGAVVFGGVRITAESGPAPEPSPERVGVHAAGPLLVRAVAPGDRLPLAGGGRQRVGRLLAADGVSPRGRGGVPVVAREDRVIWVAGHRAAPDLLAEPGTPSTILAMERT